ncbi:hypothetical protein AAHA92_06239 [Salvia divinorum]|uniref:Uncharacterized protein n=1 Tax=Salvia divinorum TaxID=28513 RepID=A0ABD1I521_SALDI
MALGVRGSKRLDHLSDESGRVSHSRRYSITGVTLEAAADLCFAEIRRMRLFVILTLGVEDELKAVNGGTLVAKLRLFWKLGFANLNVN